MFVAGRKGMMSQAAATTSWREVRSEERRMVRKRWRKAARVRRVVRFLGSEREVMSGMEPMVQSQHRPEGQRRRPRLTGRRWVRVRARGRGAAWLPGLSNLVNTGREEPCRCSRPRSRMEREARRLKTGTQEEKRPLATSPSLGLVLGLERKLNRVRCNLWHQQSS